MDPSPFEPELVAPCGMNCGVCKAHLRRRNPCRGCREADQNRPASRANCRIRLCTERGGPFCFGCAGFPCDRLKRLDARYRARYGMSEIENLECIRERGMERFLESERERWVADGCVLCVHDKNYYPVRGGERSP